MSPTRKGNGQSEDQRVLEARTQEQRHKATELASEQGEVPLLAQTGEH